MNKQQLKAYHRAYYAKNKDKILKRRQEKGYKSIGYMHAKRFGGLREEIIQRDGEQCYDCGMTREEHKEKYGRDITVDHIDNQGRYSDEPNNDPDNLLTRCMKCHGKKDRAYGMALQGM